MAIRLILADDHPIILHGLQRLFEHQSGFTVVRCCAGGQEALEAVRTHKPDVLVLDLRMPGSGGLDVLRALRHDGAGCRTVMLTAAIRDEDVVEAVQLGVRGIVLKESPPESLVECVRRVHQGEEWIDRDTLTRAFGRMVRHEPAPGSPETTLTKRELEILRLVAEGLRNKEVAERLSLSVGTVKIHLHNVYDKLGVDGRLELVLCAQQKGLV